MRVSQALGSALALLAPARVPALVIVLLCALAACAPSPDEWARRLNDPDPFKRAMAAVALGEAQPSDAEFAIRALVGCLDAQEPAFRAHLLAALSRQARPETLPVFADEVHKRIHSLEAREAGLRGALAPVHDRIVPRLVEELGRAEREQDDIGLAVLPYVGEPAVDAVAARLTDPSPRARLRAVRVLGAIGRDASYAELSVVARVLDEDSDVASAAQAALEQIAPRWDNLVAQVPLESPADRARRLARGLRGPTERRKKIAEALLCRDADSAATTFIEDLDGANPVNSRRALYALSLLLEHRCIGRGEPVLHGQDAAANRALAILRVGSRTEERDAALAEFLRALGDERTSVRCCAALAIGRMGRDAASAEPVLVEIAERTTGTERDSARVALREIHAR